MMKKLLVSTLLLMGGMSMQAQAAGSEALIKQNLQKVNARIQVESISEAPVKGMYEVMLNTGEVLYSDEKGEYFLLGKLYQFSEQEGFVDLTEQKQSALRKEALAKIPAEQMIVYPPKGEVKATVNVFTDVDCPYCRKLHAEVPKLNAMGVQVNYLAFPRQGAGTATYRDMVSIWCATDAAARRKAMDLAKNGGDLEAKTCDDPVLDQLQLGQNMGVTGTPAIVLSDGTLLPGYVPAAQLAKTLELN
ncbi:DsbC family protein [Neptuniibacter pectenicola]|jgi:thiol:disulfide interchange protein DsbC|uniref:DsbC family protein n=1 Tax=Neptuniibacter pectenicola TaxID=1806669 RepID=UPI003EEB52C0